VVTAVNGEEALHLYLKNPHGIDVVLLDMTMPVMSGEETLKRLLAIKPDAAVVAMSGFDEREAKRRFGRGIAGFVQKPFAIHQLSTIISAAKRSKTL
jgi:YesN/AraC family two-component response regulator